MAAAFQLVLEAEEDEDLPVSYMQMSWPEGRSFVMARGTLFCHGQRDALLSWPEGRSFVMARGTLFCHGQRDALLSWPEGRSFVMANLPRGPRNTMI